MHFSEPQHSQNSLFRHMHNQAYLGILMHIQSHSQVLDQGEKGRPPLLFLKIQKSPDCVLFWIKFFIQNVVLGVSRRKNFKMFPCGVSFSCAFVEILSKCPTTTIHLPPPPFLPSCPEKSLVVHLHSCITLFAILLLNDRRCSEYVFFSITAQ